MARISGVDIPREKRLEIALTYIFGIGKPTAQRICGDTDLDPNQRVRDLTEDEVNKIRVWVDANITVEGDLRREVAQDIKRKIEIGCFQGVRHRKGLPVRGQRTHTNARTRKGPKKTVANKKKAVRKYMAKPKPGGRRPRKRERKNVTVGVVHIKSSFNNTIVSITDTEGNVISWASSGGVGFKGSRKSTPFAAQMAAEKAARAAMEHGLRRVEVQVKGPGSGRDTAVRSIQNTGHRGHLDQGRHPRTAQRLPPAEASQDLIDMARYTGPKVRVSRRLGTNIFENEKGRKALERRPFPPGQHGRTRRRNAGSEYLAQLQEKQKAKYIYGVLERQFRNTYEEAIRLAGPDR